MSGLVAILKVWGVGLARRVDRANADRQRWMRGLPGDTQGREQDGERSS